MAIMAPGAVPFRNMAETRTPAEVTGLRAAAEHRVGSSAYMAVRCGSTLLTLDWLTGVGPAPVTGELTAADDESIFRELLEAEEREESGVGRGDAHVEPGVVAQTLRWYQRAAGTEAPVL